MAKAGKGTVFVGLSGGVDSATSAALLQKQGYAVVGVFIRIALPGYPCPAVEDRIEAMRVAAHLRIPFREIDLSKDYAEKIFTHTLEEFARGRTPNPDTQCNRDIKFGLFFAYAMQNGADYVATGHYARTKDGLLYTGVDTEKDQSYFLYMVPQEQLKKTIFPIGHLTKQQVRALAKKYGLPNARRKDSQGLCFLGDVTLVDVLKKELTPKPGAVLDEKGVAIGSHQGAALYTLGQRYGFTLFAHTPNTKPHYVISKDVTRNTLTVSVSAVPVGYTTTTLELQDTNWIGGIVQGHRQARFRYRQTLTPALLNIKNGIAQVCLKKPFYIPEGQALVLYQGERCLGGGVIAHTILA